MRDKKICPYTADTTVLGKHIEMKCVLPVGHAGLHLSPYGRWWNKRERDDEYSKGMDNPNAKSATGRTKRVYVLPADMGRKK